VRTDVGCGPSYGATIYRHHRDEGGKEVITEYCHVGGWSEAECFSAARAEARRLCATLRPAFVVAGAMKEGLISDIRNAAAKAIENGTTLAEFRKDFDKAVADHGWSYKGSRGWRTGVIFNTNLRMAYAAGRWQQAQELKTRRRYGRYVHVSSAHERKEHAAWHGTVLPLDDPWVSTHWGPNGWGCKCSWQTLSERDLKRYGYNVGNPPPTTEWEVVPVNTPAGPVPVKTPKGIDPGFGYNVGEAAWGRGAETLALEKHGPWEPMTAPAAPPTDLVQAVKPVAKLGKRAADEAGLREALRKAIGGDQAIFTDPTGARVNVGQAIVDHMLAKPGRHDGREAFFPFMREVVENPAEVWVGFARSTVSGRVEMRRRYIKLLDLGKSTTVGIVADADGGQWSGVTFFRGGVSGLNALRQGVRAYRKGEQ
jgi:hypothetical protein